MLRIAPKQSLKGGMPPPMEESMEEMPLEASEESPEQPNGEAISLLEQAIELHAGHMEGSEPTTPQSQELLMTLLETALEALSSPSDEPVDNPESVE